MANNLVLGLTALLALVPASILPFRRRGWRRDRLFWLLLAAALIGPLTLSLLRIGDAWQTGFSWALWVSVTATLALFTLLAGLTHQGWRLAPLLLPYLCLLAALAVIWGHAPDHMRLVPAPATWLGLHIAVSVATYALCTLAAVAGAAVFLQERALKRKRPTRLTRMLPSIVDAEVLQLRLLAASEAVLGLGVVSGMALEYLTIGQLLIADHKTILSLLAFALIGLLLLLHQRSGLRGRRAARVVLLAYLLLTLAYPGVKFVTDVLLA